jgi:hypothetical protein
MTRGWPTFTKTSRTSQGRGLCCASSIMERTPSAGNGILYREAVVY